MRRYITYIRCSTKEQGRSGLGLEAQKRDIDCFWKTTATCPRRSSVPFRMSAPARTTAGQNRQGARHRQEDRRRASRRQAGPSFTSRLLPGPVDGRSEGSLPRRLDAACR